MEQQLKDKVKDFTYFSLALDESSDARDTAQLLIFLRGKTPDIEITEELNSKHQGKGFFCTSDVQPCQRLQGKITPPDPPSRSQQSLPPSNTTGLFPIR
jgi:hypothetical protein